MKAAALAVLALVSLQAQAQTYKCVDEKKRVTYSNTACDKQGLKDAGPIPDRLMTLPPVDPSRSPRREPAKPAARPEPEDMDAGRGAQVKPVVPQVEKLTK